MEAYGTVTKVEIDRKKGFAYVDFAEPEGLQKALQASPVRIAEGQVVVLERKDRPAGGVPSSTRGGRADRGRGRGGSTYGSPRGGGRGGGGRGGSSSRGGGRGGQAASTSANASPPPVEGS